jgi:hypothetical protein
MNRKIFAVIVCPVIVAVFVWLQIASAATLGKQIFVFIAKGRNCYWITEDITGEYHSSHLLQLVTTEDSAALGKFELKNFGQWAQLAETAEKFRTEQPIELTITEDKKLTAENPDWTISAPGEDAELFEKFRDHIKAGGSNAKTWHKKMGRAGVTAPKLNSAKAELLYYYPSGLYVNYDLDRAYYFERSGQVLLFTTNQARAVGMDTMHGFMVLKLTETGK